MTTTFFIYIILITGNGIVSAQAPAAQNPLFTPQQAAIENQALQIYRNQTYQAGVRVLENTQLAQTPPPDADAAAQYQSYRDQLSYQAGLLTVTLLTAYITGNVTLVQNFIPEHIRNGTTYPGAKVVLDNPDTLYRYITSEIFQNKKAKISCIGLIFSFFNHNWFSAWLGLSVFTISRFLESLYRAI